MDAVSPSLRLPLNLIFHDRTNITIGAVTKDEMIGADDHVTQPAADPNSWQAPPAYTFAPIGAPGSHRVALHLGMRDRLVIDHRWHKALRCHHSRKRTGGERSAAEPEDVDLIAGFPVP